jgi:hypothetical protein
VGFAACAVMAAAPACAVAQDGFPDYRQAAADQYPTQPPPATSGAGGNPSGANPVTAGSSGNPRPAGKSKSKSGGNTTKRSPSSATSPGSTGGTAAVAVSTRPVPAAKGSLPFTGSDLSGLVVLALILLATGFLLAAAARATRHRRRRAPA